MLLCFIRLLSKVCLLTPSLHFTLSLSGLLRKLVGDPQWDVERVSGGLSSVWLVNVVRELGAQSDGSVVIVKFRFFSTVECLVL
jgi:hypothetical protein